MARKNWDDLTPAYRGRLERRGITRSAYNSGASLQQARGHKVEIAGVPESQRGFYETEWKRRRTREIDRNPNANRDVISRRYQSSGGRIRIIGREDVDFSGNLSPAERRMIGEHTNLVKGALAGDRDAIAELERYEGVTIDGKELAASEDAVLDLWNQGKLNFDVIYENESTSRR